MKFRFTITVDIKDPRVFELDDRGLAVGPVIGKIDREEVAHHVAEATKYWGGQFAADDTLFPTNIHEVRVRTKDITISVGG